MPRRAAALVALLVISLAPASARAQAGGGAPAVRPKFDLPVYRGVRKPVFVSRFARVPIPAGWRLTRERVGPYLFTSISKGERSGCPQLLLIAAKSADAPAGNEPAALGLRRIGGTQVAAGDRSSFLLDAAGRPTAARLDLRHSVHSGGELVVGGGAVQRGVIAIGVAREVSGRPSTFDGLVVQGGVDGLTEERPVRGFSCLPREAERLHQEAIAAATTMVSGFEERRAGRRRARPR